MEWYQTRPKEAKRIVVLANKGFTIAAIARETGFSWDRVKCCLKKAKFEKSREARINEQWKGPIIKYRYSFQLWQSAQETIREKKFEKFNRGKKEKWEPFTSFLITYSDEAEEARGRRVARSPEFYIFAYLSVPEHGEVPSKSQVFNWVNDGKYGLKRNFFPHMLKKTRAEHKIQIKPEKFLSIENRAPKEKLRTEPGNQEIDSLIGKSTDKKAIATMKDMCTGQFAATLYSRDSLSFLEATKRNLASMENVTKTITMDNGGENARLGELGIDIELYNCHAYCSWEKGGIENVHKLVRRIFPKGMSLDNVTEAQVQIMVYSFQYLSRMAIWKVALYF